jgi:hypothetical protein
MFHYHHPPLCSLSVKPCTACLNDVNRKKKFATRLRDIDSPAAQGFINDVKLCANAVNTYDLLQVRG